MNSELPLNGIEKNKRDKDFRNDLIFEFIVLFVVVFCGFFLASQIDTDLCPDEYMRYPLAQYIANHHSLPTGFEEEIVNEIWGTSYGFAPYLPQIIGAVFMRLVSVFTKSEYALLLACRSVSVLSCAGAVFFCFRAGKYIFRQRGARLLFPLIVGFLPQVTFLSCYVNNDAPSLFCSCFILYALLRGQNEHWSIKSSFILAFALSFAALTYYFCYGWIVVSVIFYFYTTLADESLDGAKKKIARLFSRGFLIAGVCLVLAGWYFIRNAIIYDGDVLGFGQSAICREMYSQSTGRVYFSGSPWKDTGKSVFEMVFSLLGPNGGMFPDEWPFFYGVYYGFIGNFGYMTSQLNPYIYKAYTVLFALGGAVFLLIPKKKDGKKTLAFWLCIILAAVFPILLCVYNAYMNDYSPQGRYIISLLPALACILCRGLEKTGERISKKAEALPPLIFGAAWSVLWIVSYGFFMIPNLLINA